MTPLAIALMACTSAQGPVTRVEAPGRPPTAAGPVRGRPPEAGRSVRGQSGQIAEPPPPVPPLPAPPLLEEPRPPDTSLWSKGRIAAYARSLELPLAPLAILEIPRLGLRVAVFEGTQDVILDRGAGHVPGTAPLGSDGNVAIAGHRDGYFRVLKDVALGDLLRLVTPSGVREYRIAATSIVEPEQVGVLEPTPEPAVTLIACYPFYFVGHAPQRFIARANAVDQETAGTVP